MLWVTGHNSCLGYLSQLITFVSLSVVEFVVQALLLLQNTIHPKVLLVERVRWDKHFIWRDILFEIEEGRLVADLS